MQYSVAVRNASLDAIETAIGASPVLKLRTGAMPASCGTADSGTELAVLNLPADWMLAAANGSKAKNGNWEDAAADASGFASFFRIYASDGTTCHLQGLVSQDWAASTAYAVGQQVNRNGNVYRATAAGTSAGSGGPAGTGNGITDGGVTWNYVGPSFMVIDNTNIAAGQGVTVATFVINKGNA